jgi:hypothetical protein
MSLTPLPRFLLPSRARVRIVLVAILAAVAFGTVAFHLIEVWSILDSLYVTAQTVTRGDSGGELDGSRVPSLRSWAES